jgi:hypothetical protein
MRRSRAVIWPSELDPMARIAGMVLREPCSGWMRERGNSRTHGSVPLDLSVLAWVTYRRSASSFCSSSRSRRPSGIFEALSVCKVSSAQARKHAAPSDVFQLAAA